MPTLQSLRVLATRVIKRTASSQAGNGRTKLLLIIRRRPLVFLFQASSAPASIWSARSSSKNSPLLNSPLLVLISSSIRFHFSRWFSFPWRPFIPSVTRHLSRLLSLALSSLHRYPNAFIFPLLPTFIQFLSLRCRQHFLFPHRSNSHCLLSFSCSSLFIIISQQCSSTVFAKHGVFILLAYGELSLLHRSHQYLYRPVSPIRSKQMGSHYELLMKLFSSEQRLQVG